uniref:Uncharacterized protein n=1 Tax=Cannabis sativa TaxID=3483 RepID=A0A803PKJ7_CANSA
MGNNQSLPNQVDEDGAYNPTRYIPIVELENRNLRRRLEEVNRRNAELESDIVVVKAAREDGTQNKPDIGKRDSQEKPHGWQTKGRRITQRYTQNPQEMQPEGTEKNLETQP